VKAGCNKSMLVCGGIEKIHPLVGGLKNYIYNSGLG
jgi:hypothetical protein